MELTEKGRALSQNWPQIPNPFWGSPTYTIPLVLSWEPLAIEDYFASSGLVSSGMEEVVFSWWWKLTGIGAALAAQGAAEFVGYAKVRTGIKAFFRLSEKKGVWKLVTISGFL